MPEQPKYNIKVAAHRTGLSPHVIRVWERRYGAVSPARSPTSRRLYSDAEIERLVLLRQATLAGHSIGQVANLPDERLAELIATDRAARARAPFALATGVTTCLSATGSAADFVNRCSAAVEALDAETLTTQLAQASVALSQAAMIEHVVVPLLHCVGDAWRQGSLRVAHEHFASAVVRSFLGNMLPPAAQPPAAPAVVATTPTGQLHEFGALVTAVTAASEGWQVAYLGPNLPVDEIAAAAVRTGARAVALSIVYPADDFRLREELRRLRSYVADEVALLVGGRAVEGYADVLSSIGAVKLDDMLALRTCLESLRASPMGANGAACPPMKPPQPKG